MSFSSEIKETLCKTEYECPGCRLAEIAGFFACSGKNTEDDIKFPISNKTLADRIIKSLDDEFKIIPHREGKRAVISGTDMHRLLTEINGDIFLYDCCRVAYLRGAFLGGGSVNAPDKKYHIEFCVKNDCDTMRICKILQELELKPKTTHRKEKAVVYIKESSQIADLLGYISNGRAGLEFLSVQVEKELKSSTQRQVNCDSANLEKLAKASSRHIAAIKQIKAAHKWSAMPEVLREIGELRLKHPDLSLEALGKMTEQGIGKSGVNHRLNRIVEYAEFIRKD